MHGQLANICAGCEQGGNETVDSENRRDSEVVAVHPRLAEHG
eukprot:CAMPEP_0196745982 /NCGR_PEP_ID=MMETSP1091-20130531/63870_1 /TAXON_ID=302021 /ORGANISM="Rhodomonas sp., Strain CCMP768" /LENGTH=41 /DNA_ID= /DNA_START= /DNA_END= /DNA_ORIENTATION=